MNSIWFFLNTFICHFLFLFFSNTFILHKMNFLFWKKKEMVLYFWNHNSTTSQSLVNLKEESCYTKMEYMEVSSKVCTNWCGLQQAMVKWYSKRWVSSYIFKHLSQIKFFILHEGKHKLSLRELKYHGFLWGFDHNINHVLKSFI